ncbi:unnamed protein product [Amoebophrya sp. A25]|nr:unnamed protein product [Amoebophrya sp. A25]|eukprot:GSA25T00008202001.1
MNKTNAMAQTRYQEVRRSRGNMNKSTSKARAMSFRMRKPRVASRTALQFATLAALTSTRANVTGGPRATYLDEDLLHN